MTELSTEEPDLSATQGIRARSVGFWTDLGSVSRRAVRQLPRDPEMVFPAVFIPVFFFAINVGSLQDLAESSAPPGFDFKAFQLPVAIIFAVTGISRGSLVTDIQSGYFDRLLVTPVNRLALLLGLMVADAFLVVLLSLPVVLMGFLVGVRFEADPWASSPSSGWGRSGG